MSRRIELLALLSADICRDHRTTVRMLMLLDAANNGLRACPLGVQPSPTSNVADADPTGAAALENLESHHRRWADEYHQAITDALAALVRADRVRSLMTPADPSSTPDGDLCENCLHAGHFKRRAVAQRSPYCSWCLKYRQKHGELPDRYVPRRDVGNRTQPEASRRGIAKLTEASIPPHRSYPT